MDNKRAAMLLKVLKNTGSLVNHVGAQYWAKAENSEPVIGNRKEW
jgi:hypothetical protein